MNRIETLLVGGTFLITLCIGSAFAQTIQTPKVPQVKKPAAVRPYKATPIEKPQATNERDKLSVTGYGEDPGEETQERPNPLDAKAAQTLDPMRDPIRGPKNTPSR
jgi:hypothetical protein